MVVVGLVGLMFPLVKAAADGPINGIGSLIFKIKRPDVHGLEESVKEEYEQLHKQKMKFKNQLRWKEIKASKALQGTALAVGLQKGMWKKQEPVEATVVEEEEEEEQVL